MNRWTRAALAAVFSLSAAHVLAQVVVREAPADVRPARMSVATPPEITLDGHAARLSPGARIRNTQNLVVLSGSLAGQTVPVVYRRDGAGLVTDAWILTDDEYARVGGAGGDASLLARMLASVFGARR
ncbi:hypothetical protein ACPWT1_02275 [Ramlibacter sp. MMS24-I3-19]|uniref:hypothetical protein n=1 Tax=Ramlibacter sp. MMS24-I3-19 TaxID=3416606 RepID=UPI003D048707